MNKYLFSTLMIGTSIFAFSLPSLAMEDTTSFLDWKKRPPALLKIIDDLAVDVHKRTTDWGNFPGNENNGSDYAIMGIPDPLLVDSLIHKQPEKQTWCFMDLGAGNCAWGRSMADHLTRTYSKELQEGTKRFYIFSLTGDSLNRSSSSLPNSSLNFYKRRRISSESDIDLDEAGCIVYEWGLFNIEYLADHLPKLRGKIDGIVSFATVRHVADSPGLYSQALAFLNEDGILATDEHVHAQINGHNMLLPDILTKLGLPCVICPYTDHNRDVQGVITWKTGSQLQKIPALSYTNEIILTPDLGETSSSITSPCKVCLSGDLKEPDPLLRLRFAFEEPSDSGFFGEFPEISFRRTSKRSLDYFYNTTGYEIFEKLIQPAGPQISKYLADSNSFKSEKSIIEFLFGKRHPNIPAELENLDLKGWRNYLQKVLPDPKVYKEL